MSISISQDMPKKMYWVEGYFWNDIGEFEAFPEYSLESTRSVVPSVFGIHRNTDHGFVISYDSTVQVTITPFILNAGTGSAIWKTPYSYTRSGSTSTWEMTVATGYEGYFFNGTRIDTINSTIGYYNFNTGTNYQVKNSELASCLGTYGGRVVYGSTQGKVRFSNSNTATTIPDLFDLTIGTGVEKAQEFDVSGNEIVQLLETDSALFILDETGEIYVCQGSFAQSTIQITRVGSLNRLCNPQTLVEFNGTVYATTGTGLKKIQRNVNLTAFEIKNENVEGINYFNNNFYVESRVTYIPKINNFKITKLENNKSLLVSGSSFDYSFIDGEDVGVNEIPFYNKNYIMTGNLISNEIKFYIFDSPNPTYRTGYLVYPITPASEEETYSGKAELFYKKDRIDTVSVFYKIFNDVQLLSTVTNEVSTYTGTGGYSTEWGKGNNLALQDIYTGVFDPSGQLIIKTVSGSKILGINIDYK